jgi:hypothetical protein
VISGEEGRRLSQQPHYYHLTQKEWGKLGDLIQRRTDLVYLNGLNAIYHLRPTPAEGRSPIPNLLSVFSTAPAEK